MDDVKNAGIQLYQRQVDQMIERLQGERPLVEQVPMVPTATPPRQVLRILDDQLARHRQQVLARAKRLRALLRANCALSLPQLQARYAALRIRNASYLQHYDYFFDALSQRSNPEHGIRLARLDRIAEQALRVPGLRAPMPRVLCFLDYQISAAIRRLNVRLVGRIGSPLAFLRIPRERAFSREVLGSVYHEAGHQVMALTGAVPRVQTVLRAAARRVPAHRARALLRYVHWTSELLADLFAVTRLGAKAVLSSMLVFHLPASILDGCARGSDPHPPPAIRLRFALTIVRLLERCHSHRRLGQLVEALFPTRHGRGGRCRGDRWVTELAPCVARLMLGLVQRELGQKKPTCTAARSAA